MQLRRPAICHYSGKFQVGFLKLSLRNRRKLAFVECPPQLPAGSVQGLKRLFICIARMRHVSRDALRVHDAQDLVLPISPVAHGLTESRHSESMFGFKCYSRTFQGVPYVDTEFPGGCEAETSSVALESFRDAPAGLSEDEACRPEVEPYLH